MIFYLYAVPHLLNLAVGSDQEGAPHDPLKGAAHEFLHAPDAVGFEHFVVGIAEQREIKFLFRPEFGEVLFWVATSTQDQHADFIEVLLCVAKLGRFGCSTGSVGFREEKEDDAPSAKVRERKCRAFVGR